MYIIRRGNKCLHFANANHPIITAKPGYGTTCSSGVLAERVKPLQYSDVKILKKILAAVTITRIVLDGVDECHDKVQREILESLLELQKDADNNCKLLISSRDQPRIDKIVLRRTLVKFAAKTAEGLNLFTQERVSDLKTHFPEMNPALFDRAEKRLKGKANGMFLWVHLVTTMLKQQMSELQFEDTIEKLPEGLDQAYGRILSSFCNLSPTVKDRALKILYWVCTAYRPISIHEVADGITLKPGQLVLSKKTRSQNLDRDILDVCAPILEKSNQGILDLVHFSAKEYLLDKESGPFVNVAQAHFNMAFYCVVNLTTALRVVPRFSQGAVKTDFETLTVQGTYGLQPYGHQFWAEHVKAYLETTSSLDNQAMQLIAALVQFSKASKHHSTHCVEPCASAKTSFSPTGLATLLQFPPLFDFISGWLLFKSSLGQTKSVFESLQAQQQCQLRTDETYLSLVDFHLREITERLLTMSPSTLPPHIDVADYKAFIARCSFACRFSNCAYNFDSMANRDDHEITHVPSFPCLRCDFSSRGFRSRKDLEKHTQKYHMSAEDVEIPSSLFDTFSPASASGDLAAKRHCGSVRRSGCWNEQGRKVLQRSFTQVLTKLESELALSQRHTTLQGEPDRSISSETAKDIESSVEKAQLLRNLDKSRQKVNDEQYQTLSEFKNDVHALSEAIDQQELNPARMRSSVESVETICGQELEKVMSGFPTFANFDHNSSGSASNDGFASGYCGLPRSDTNFSLETQILINVPDDSFGQRKAYWSLAEEKDFPKLLDRYGRDMAKIADYLKTKTVEEVERHFEDLMQSGRPELGSLADEADARLKLESQPLESQQETPGSDPELLLSPGNDHEVPQADLKHYDPPLEAAMPYAPDTARSWERRVPDLTSSAEKQNPRTEGTIPIDEPKRKSRRPPRRSSCPHCNEQLRDEYTVKRHIKRYHTPTRKVWICEDVSVDKRFLAKCRSCSKNKPYIIRKEAAKHLREMHFSATTSEETLLRWMKEKEECNPNYTKTETKPLSRNDPDRLPGPLSTMKRQKISGNSYQSRLFDSENSSERLPAMLSAPNQSASSIGASGPASTTGSQHNSDEEESTTFEAASSNSPRDDLLLPNVSFDNLLTGSATNAPPEFDDSVPHFENRALIRPDQVHKLPHFNNQFRKAACHDQVEALHAILNKERIGSSAYQEALKNLTSLSVTLLRMHRNWRGSLNLAPTIPFSI